MGLLEVSRWDSDVAPRGASIPANPAENGRPVRSLRLHKQRHYIPLFRTIVRYMLGSAVMNMNTRKPILLEYRTPDRLRIGSAIAVGAGLGFGIGLLALVVCMADDSAPGAPLIDLWLPFIVILIRSANWGAAESRLFLFCSPVQFTIYGVLLGSVWQQQRKRRWMAIGLIVCHVAASIVVLVIFDTRVRV